MIKIKRIRTSDKDYIKIEELLNSAFPQEERRDTARQRQYTDHNPLFYCNSITDGNEFIGLLTYWDFSEFIYIEHFATVEQHRNKGYGAQIIQKVKETVSVPIVLEAEEPTDSFSRKRIEFYRRQGFILEEYPYMQPPYRIGDGWLPMKLMTSGLNQRRQYIDTIKKRIYQEVYGV